MNKKIIILGRLLNLIGVVIKHQNSHVDLFPIFLKDKKKQFSLIYILKNNLLIKNSNPKKFVSKDLKKIRIQKFGKNLNPKILKKFESKNLKKFEFKFESIFHYDPQP